nr:hypothetical protein [uncultured Eubacterium sp.]
MDRDKMIFRWGDYVIYKETVYGINKMLDRDGEFIYIHNKEHIDDKCFENDGYMVRPITASEVDEVYSVRPYAIYKGHKVALRGSRIAEKMAITPTSMDNEDYEEIMKVLGIQHEHNGEDTVFVPIKDLDIYERVKYYDRYEYFKGIYKPYKVEDYHVIIKDGELNRYKVE